LLTGSRHLKVKAPSQRTKLTMNRYSSPMLTLADLWLEKTSLRLLVNREII